MRMRMSVPEDGSSFVPFLPACGRGAVILLALCALLIPSTGAAQDLPPTPTANPQVIENLRAFAKLYGYVRHFHPSDESAAVQWDRFAVHGARRVVDATGPAELRSTLTDLFAPLAPAMQLLSADQPTPDPHPALLPADTSGMVLVAWQHRGIGLGAPGPYSSIRLNRQAPAAGGSRFGAVSQRVEASAYRGMELRLRAALRADTSWSGSQGQLWLRVDRRNQQRGFFDNMSDRPVRSGDWEVVEISGTIASDADWIVLGAILPGEGRIWIDQVELAVRKTGSEQWSVVPLANPGFEDRASGSGPVGWASSSADYVLRISDREPFRGSGSLVFERSTEPPLAAPLFREHPAPGETVRRTLGQGLTARIPIAVFSSEGRTLPDGNAVSLAALRSALESTDMAGLTGPDAGVRFGATVIAWNILQHFYPYFDVVAVDWDAVLTETLRRAERDRTVEEFLATLRWMVAQLEDGHGRVSHASEQGRLSLPFLFDRVEGRIVITATDASNPPPCGRPGDILVSIDGRPTEQVLTELERFISGSPQWRTRRALWELGMGPAHAPARMSLERAGSTTACEATRVSRIVTEDRPAPIEQLRDGVHYVDLSRADSEAIIRHISELADARGIIFDLRGYPNANHTVLQHLTSVPLTSAHWQIPHQIYPDQEALVGYETSGRWRLPPAGPRFSGKIVFLTDERAISYAESVMGIVEHHGLGEIVGRTTAAANGNVNRASLPGGFTITWTGMRVLKHDESQHHLIGIRPTVPVVRTLAAVRDGRDEDLEAALALIEAGIASRR